MTERERDERDLLMLRAYEAGSTPARIAGYPVFAPLTRRTIQKRIARIIRDDCTHDIEARLYWSAL